MDSQHHFYAEVSGYHIMTEAVPSGESTSLDIGRSTGIRLMTEQLLDKSELHSKSSPDRDTACVAGSFTRIGWHGLTAILGDFLAILVALVFLCFLWARYQVTRQTHFMIYQYVTLRPAQTRPIWHKVSLVKDDTVISPSKSLFLNLLKFLFVSVPGT